MGFNSGFKGLNVEARLIWPVRQPSFNKLPRTAASIGHN